MYERKNVYKSAIFLIMLIFCNSVLANRIIYVDDDGPADFNNIQAAIDDANDGDTVLVADGTYTGDGNRDIDFLGKAITVKSENGPEYCIVDCQASELYLHRGFIFYSYEDVNSILTGFTITGGCASWGAGILIQHSSPTISHCIIQGNTCDADDNGRKQGGGICIYYSDNPIISDCIISNNKCTGSSYGGGISCLFAKPVIQRCVITDNQARNHGGGIYCSCEEFLIKDCIISNNIVTYRVGGGIDIDFSSGNIENCLVTGNQSSYYGSGINLQYCDVNIINCTIANNYSSLENSGGVYCELSNINILNSILWSNKNPQNSQIFVYSNSGIEDGPHNPTPTINSQLNIAFSALQDNHNGIYIYGEPDWFQLTWDDGNIDVDPLFADSNDDYHLKSQTGRFDSNSQSWIIDDVTSPCIDTGDPMSPIGLEQFPNGGFINMGAYGGTFEASKSYFGEPVCEIIIAGDINGDCKVDIVDLEILLTHWLEEH